MSANNEDTTSVLHQAQEARSGTDSDIAEEAHRAVNETVLAITQEGDDEQTEEQQDERQTEDERVREQEALLLKHDQDADLNPPLVAATLVMEEPAINVNGTAAPPAGALTTHGITATVLAETDTDEATHVDGIAATDDSRSETETVIASVVSSATYSSSSVSSSSSMVAATTTTTGTSTATSTTTNSTTASINTTGEEPTARPAPMPTDRTTIGATANHFSSPLPSRLSAQRSSSVLSSVSNGSAAEHNHNVHPSSDDTTISNVLTNGRGNTRHHQEVRFDEPDGPVRSSLLPRTSADERSVSMASTTSLSSTSTRLSSQHFAQMHQPTPRLPETVQQVHFDAPPPPESAPPYPTDQKQSHWDRTAVGRAVFFFLLGFGATLTTGYFLIVLRDSGDSLGIGDDGQAIGQGPLATPSPIAPASPPPTPTNNGNNNNGVVPSAPTPAPVSGSPSAAPSCSGMFELSSSLSVFYSGFGQLALSQDGMAMVGASYDQHTGMFSLLTFDLEFDLFYPQHEGYHIVDMQMSGDGSTLVLGLSDVYDEQGKEVVGGALVMMKRDTFLHTWKFHQQIVTGGGRYGRVRNVAVSWNGTTVGLAEGPSGNIRVFREAIGTNQLGELSNDGLPIASNFTELALSGDGNTLFVASSDSTVTALRYDPNVQQQQQQQGQQEEQTPPQQDGYEQMPRRNDQPQRPWRQLGDDIQLVSVSGRIPRIRTVFDGSLLIVGSDVNVPITVYEFINNGWQAFEELDITKGYRNKQFMTVSDDGRNIVICEETATRASARWYHRSGTVFAALQDFNLQSVKHNNTSPKVKDMTLNQDGEQLTVVYEDDEVVWYRKDCASVIPQTQGTP